LSSPSSSSAVWGVEEGVFTVMPTRCSTTCLNCHSILKIENLLDSNYLFQKVQIKLKGQKVDRGFLELQIDDPMVDCTIIEHDEYNVAGA
jgi:hypothetical protein